MSSIEKLLSDIVEQLVYALVVAFVKVRIAGKDKIEVSMISNESKGRLEPKEISKIMHPEVFEKIW